MSLLGFFDWLASTAGSIALHESLYAYRIVSTVHVVTLSVFVGTAALLDLRLLGVALRSIPVSEVAGRLRPWTMAGFALMIVSGAPPSGASASCCSSTWPTDRRSDCASA